MRNEMPSTWRPRRVNERSSASYPMSKTYRNIGMPRFVLILGLCLVIQHETTLVDAGSASGYSAMVSSYSMWDDASNASSFQGPLSPHTDDDKGSEVGQSQDQLEETLEETITDTNDSAPKEAPSDSSGEKANSDAADIFDQDGQGRNKEGHPLPDENEEKSAPLSQVVSHEINRKTHEFLTDSEHDGTTGMMSLEKEHEAKGPVSTDESEENVVVSDVEVDWFDSEGDSASTAGENRVATIEVPHEGKGHGHDEARNEIEEVTNEQDGESITLTRRLEELGTPNDIEVEEEPEATPVSMLAVEADEDESDDEIEETPENPMNSDSDASDWTEDDKSDIMEDSGSESEESTSSTILKDEVFSPLTPPPRQGLPQTSNAQPVREMSKIEPAVIASEAAAAAGPKPEKPTRHKRRREGSVALVVAPSQPLQTLQKLQQMLDETDYMSAPGTRVDEVSREAVGGDSMRFVQETAEGAYEQNEALMDATSSESKEGSLEGEKLWTSKDRMKYKKQQQRLRRARAEQRRLEQQLRSPPVHPNSSDDEESDDTDDGLGYTLPNLPVYFSDSEGTTDVTDTDYASQQTVQQQRSPLQPPPPPFEQRGSYQHPLYGYQNPYNVSPLPDQSSGQVMPPYMGYPPPPFVPYPPYGPYNPQQQQQQHLYAQQYGAWAAAAASGMSPYGTARPSYNRPYQPQLRSNEAIMPRNPDNAPTTNDAQETKKESSTTDCGTPRHIVVPSTPMEGYHDSTTTPDMTQITGTTNTGQTALVAASSKLNIDSMQKISVTLIGVALLCYSAVSPRMLPTDEYNVKFVQNIRIIAMATIAPIFNFLFVYDPQQNDVNSAVNSFYEAFTLGYGLAFVLELVFTTLIRLGVFVWFEPDVFKLTPQVPAIILPWVLRENRYRPKRITLFAADYATSCVVAPIIEEYVKLKILQWSVRLPRNFRWTTKKSSKNKKHKRKVAEVIPRSPGDSEVTNINSYVSQMLAVSTGIKLCDSTRRILMYTKDRHAYKGFYAFCRGMFPIHELCGTMTALALAKRDVLGWDMPLWKILAPAVVIHGMANYRGMKPIFKWNSATPWSEMQLPLDSSEWLSTKGFGSLMWFIILARVLGYCAKNYFLISRQAVKRTTTYAGKRAAFSAELAAGEMLKKTAKDK